MNRRRLVTLTVPILAAALALTACGGGSDSAPTGDQVKTIKWGYYDTGGAAAISYISQVIAAHPEIQEKHGLKLTAVPYKNVQELYTDIAQGRVDLMSGGLATMAAANAQGAPIITFGGLAPTSTTIVGKHKEWTKEALTGSRITGMNSATWELCAAWIEKNWGLKAGTDYTYLPAQSNAGARTGLAGLDVDRDG